MSKAQKEAARRFPTGAKVRLSVGGPVMVVDGATADGRVVCRWFDGSKLERAKLAPELLVTADATAGTATEPASAAAPNGSAHPPAPLPAPRAGARKRSKAAGGAATPEG